MVTGLDKKINYFYSLVLEDEIGEAISYMDKNPDVSREVGGRPLSISKLEIIRYHAKNLRMLAVHEQFRREHNLPLDD